MEHVGSYTDVNDVSRRSRLNFKGSVPYAHRVSTRVYHHGFHFHTRRCPEDLSPP